jgi:hypothetical protein
MRSIFFASRKNVVSKSPLRLHGLRQGKGNGSMQPNGLIRIDFGDHEDAADETHSAWSVNLIGVSGRTSALNWLHSLKVDRWITYAAIMFDLGGCY